MGCGAADEAPSLQPAAPGSSTSGSAGRTTSPAAGAGAGGAFGGTAFDRSQLAAWSAHVPPPRSARSTPLRSNQLTVQNTLQDEVHVLAGIGLQGIQVIQTKQQLHVCCRCTGSGCSRTFLSAHISHSTTPIEYTSAYGLHQTGK